MVSFAHVRTQAHDIFILKRGSAAVSAKEKGRNKTGMFVPALLRPQWWRSAPVVSQQCYFLRPCRRCGRDRIVFSVSRSARYVFLHFTHTTDTVTFPRPSERVSPFSHHGHFR